MGESFASITGRLVNMMDDLGPNKARLFEVASTALPGDVLVDLGVRNGTSSFTMLEATEEQQSRVIGVDCALCPWTFAKDRYQYIHLDSVSVVEHIDGPLFLVFFDTLHIKQQVMAELFHYWPKIRVGGWAVFHDTEWPEDKHDVYLDIVWPQAIEGVKAFFGDVASVRGLSAKNEHVRFDHYPESYGMTFVQKLDDWNPTVDGMEQALEVSRMLTDALCK